MKPFALLLAVVLACPAAAIDDVQPTKPAGEGDKKEKKEGRDYEESKYISLSPEAGKSQFRFNSDGDAILSEKAQKRIAEAAKKKAAAKKAAAKKAAKAEKAAAADAAATEKRVKKPRKKVVKKSLKKQKSFGEAEEAEGGAEGIDPALAAQAAQAMGGKIPGMGGDE